MKWLIVMKLDDKSDKTKVNLFRVWGSVWDNSNIVIPVKVYKGNPENILKNILEEIKRSKLK